MPRPVFALLFAASVLTLPGVAIAQTDAATTASQTADGNTPQRVRSVMLQGNEKCPTAAGDEIVVCSKINPDEQYRIPKEQRRTAEPAARDQSWVNRAVSGEQASRAGAGLPNTCSPVGTGGQSGCALANARAFAAEKRATEKNDSMIPGGRPD